MAQNEIRVAVIIANHGRPALLRRTLRSLAGSRNQPGEDTELLVVENGDPAGAEEACRAYREVLPVRYMHVPRLGKSNALNIAVEQTKADLLLFFDDDVRVGSGTPAAFRRAARRHGPGHFFGGPVAVDYESPPPDWLVRFLPPSARGWTLGEEEIFHDEPDFLGGNWAAFRRDVREAGGFCDYLGPRSDGFRLLAEETELQERLLERRCRGVYVPDAPSWHWVPRERCTPEWARDRWFRAAVTAVLREDPDLERYPRIAQVPRFLWRQCLEEGLRALAARLFLRPGTRRMKYEMRWARSRGRAVGYRLAAKLAEASGSAEAGEGPKAAEP